MTNAAINFNTTLCIVPYAVWFIGISLRIRAVVRSGSGSGSSGSSGSSSRSSSSSSSSSRSSSSDSSSSSAGNANSKSPDPDIPHPDTSTPQSKHPWCSTREPGRLGGSHNPSELGFQALLLFLGFCAPGLSGARVKGVRV